MTTMKSGNHVVTSQKVSDAPNARFTVIVVSSDGSETKHDVTVSERTYHQLTNGDTTLETLLEQSFNFLLERESKENILANFDLSVISNYFSDYETTIKERLQKSNR